MHIDSKKRQHGNLKDIAGNNLLFFCDKVIQTGKTGWGTFIHSIQNNIRPKIQWRRPVNRLKLWLITLYIYSGAYAIQILLKYLVHCSFFSDKGNILEYLVYMLLVTFLSSFGFVRKILFLTLCVRFVMKTFYWIW